MAKLGYTWYPKDWGSSENVFELSLSERGLYREIIDLAMMNDNKTEIKLDTWVRKFAVNLDELKSILGKLSILNLIRIDGEKLFVPSCESRLNMVRGGSKGGKNPKPKIKGIVKGIVKPIESLEENNGKPIVKQTKIETKTKTKIETNIPEYLDFILYAKEQKPFIDEYSVKAKYETWIENNWKDGNGNEIKNWKTKLKNTLPYLKENINNKLKTDESITDIARLARLGLLNQ